MFELGKIIKTGVINGIMTVNKDFAKEVNTCLDEYSNGKWGIADTVTQARNNRILDGTEKVFTGAYEQIRGVYKTSAGIIHIVTDNRETTTIALASEI